jgi:hypothetical protein
LSFIRVFCLVISGNTRANENRTLTRICSTIDRRTTTTMLTPDTGRKYAATSNILKDASTTSKLVSMTRSRLLFVRGNLRVDVNLHIVWESVGHRGTKEEYAHTHILYTTLAQRSLLWTQG